MTGIPYAEVIGDPIGHSRSPAIHRFWLSRLGIEADYRATHVARDALADHFTRRRADPAWQGCNITIPHKQSALDHLDAVEDGGLGAVNCVLPIGHRLVGRNTDLGGLDSALPANVGPGDRVLVIGGGGAGAAAVAALKGRQVQCDILVRRPEQGQELLDRIGAEGRIFPLAAAVEAIAGSSGLINASPLGMTGFPAMPPDLLGGLRDMAAGGFVLDMVYVPLRTALLDAAEGHGLKAVDGLEMLIGQAALAFSFFFGAEAPRDLDPELRMRLSA